MQPELIVLHYTAMVSCDAAFARLCDPAAEVSAHYLISEQGEVLGLVPEEKRAWHAGAGAWRGLDDVNSRSIGIELANDGAHPFAAAQMRALEALMAEVMARWAIPARGVIAHSDMAPGRKIDPGARFDWRRLALQGLAVWPRGAMPRPTMPRPTMPRPTMPRPTMPRPTMPRATDAFMRDAQRFGYQDAGDDAVLAAFRLRFRPWAKGPLDAVDASMMADLADRFGVDAMPTLA